MGAVHSRRLEDCLDFWRRPAKWFATGLENWRLLDGMGFDSYRLRYGTRQARGRLFGCYPKALERVVRRICTQEGTRTLTSSGLSGVTPAIGLPGRRTLGGARTRIALARADPQSAGYANSPTRAFRGEGVAPSSRDSKTQCQSAGTPSRHGRIRTDNLFGFEPTAFTSYATCPFRHAEASSESL
jgi:hypothetical protein